MSSIPHQRECSAETLTDPPQVVSNGSYHWQAEIVLKPWA